MTNYYSIKQASNYLHVAQSTLRRWEDEGKIKPKRTSGNQRRYTQEMLDSLLSSTSKQITHKKMIIGYCRVSSSHQKDDLERQKQVVTSYCEKQGQPFKILSDVGSGLNYNRKEFNQLIHYICQHKCSAVVANYQDRLVRFGFDLIKAICKENDVDLIVINQTTAEDPNQELVNDVLSVITVFSAKLYGKRSHKNEKIIKENKALFTKNG